MAAPSSEQHMWTCKMRPGKVMWSAPLAPDRAGVKLSVFLGNKWKDIAVSLIAMKTNVWEDRFPRLGSIQSEVLVLSAVD